MNLKEFFSKYFGLFSLLEIILILVVVYLIIDALFFRFSLTKKIYKALAEIPPFRWITKENYELLLIALLMAITVRCFVFEIYKIPTSSMEPTLLGIHDRNVYQTAAVGDKVLVNKFIYTILPVKRFDVVAFRYPLQRTKNFVKRCVGLPNEDIALVDGDIYYRKKGESLFQIARKPLYIQESIWLPPNLDEPKRFNFSDYWRYGNISQYSGDWQQWKTLLHDLPMKFKNGSKYELKLKEPLRDRYFVKAGKIDSGEHIVQDVKLVLDVEFTGKNSLPFNQDGKFAILLAAKGNEFEFTMLPGRSPVLRYRVGGIHKTMTTEKNIVVEKNKRYKISFMHFDGSIVIKLNRSVVFDFPYQKAVADLKDVPEGWFDLTLVIDNIDLVINGFEIYRDLYYYDDEGVLKDREIVSIPPKSYFFIGDHVTNSHDSRLWRKDIAVLKDGKKIVLDNSEQNSELNQQDGYVSFRDEYGIYHNLPEGEITNLSEVLDTRITRGYQKFVSEDLIMGKVIAVLWPVYPQFRVKLVR